MAALVLLSFTLPLLLPFFTSDDSHRQMNDTTDTRPQVPDFVLPSANGQLVRLADTAAAHSSVIIVFHRGSSCSVCRDQLAEFAASYTQLRQQGAELLAIGAGTREEAGQLARRIRADYPVLYDAEGTILSAYGLTEQLKAQFTTAIFIVDQRMQIIGTPVGTSGHEILPAEAILKAVRQVNGSNATSS